jgi:hypothetical protein
MQEKTRITISDTGVCLFFSNRVHVYDIIRINRVQLYDIIRMESCDPWPLVLIWNGILFDLQIPSSR